MRTTQTWQLVGLLLVGALALASAQDVSAVLAEYPQFSTFNELLNSTGVLPEVNSRSSLTILLPDNALLNSYIGANPSYTTQEVADVLRYHVLLQYFGFDELTNLNVNGGVITTLYQTTGRANGLDGFVNITVQPGGSIAVSPSTPGAPIQATIITNVTQFPYNYSFLQISGVLEPLGLAAAQLAPTAPPAPAPTAPVPAPVQVPAAAPAQVPVAAPAQVPVAAPAPVPVPAPAPVPVAAPARVPVAAPAQVPVPAPAQVPVPAPAQVPVPAPAQVPVAAPAQVPVAAPAQVPVAAPAQVPVAAPAQVPVAAPAQVPVAAPVSSPALAPSSESAPVIAPVVAPIVAPVAAPVPSTAAPVPSPASNPSPNPALIATPVLAPATTLAPVVPSNPPVTYGPVANAPLKSLTSSAFSVRLNAASLVASVFVATLLL